MKKKDIKKYKTKKTSISLSPYYVDIIDREMASGKYSSVSHLVCNALLLLEKESFNLNKAKRKNKN